MSDVIDEILKFDPGNVRQSKDYAEELLSGKINATGGSRGDEIDEILKFDPGPGTTQKKSFGVSGSWTEDKDLTWRQAFSKALGNVGESAERFGRDLVQPILHPVETGKALGKTAAGAVQNPRRLGVGGQKRGLDRARFSGQPAGRAGVA